MEGLFFFHWRTARGVTLSLLTPSVVKRLLCIPPCFPGHLRVFLFRAFLLLLGRRQAGDQLQLECRLSAKGFTSVTGVIPPKPHQIGIISCIVQIKGTEVSIVKSWACRSGIGSELKSHPRAHYCCVLQDSPPQRSTQFNIGLSCPYTGTHMHDPSPEKPIGEEWDRKTKVCLENVYWFLDRGNTRYLAASRIPLTTKPIQEERGIKKW